MWRRRALCLLLPLAILLSACNSTPVRSATESTPAGAAEAAQPGDDPNLLRLGDYGWPNPALDLLIEGFQAANPGVRVEKVTLETSMTNNQMYEKASKGEIDLMPMENGDRGKNRAIVLALEPLIARSRFDLAPLGSVLEQVKYNGRLMELPYLCLPTRLVYNKDLFAKAGIEPPAAGFTWEEFRALAAKLSTGQGDDRVFGFDTGTMHDLVRIWVEAKTGRPIWKSDPEAVREGVEFFATLVLTDNAAPSATLQDWASGRSSWGYDFTRFLAGKVAMVATQAARAPGQANDTVGFLPVPVHPGKKAITTVDIQTLAIPEKSPKQDLAWGFLQFAAGEEGAAILARAGHQPMYITDKVREAAQSPDQQWTGEWTLDHPIAFDQDQAVWAFARYVNEVLSGKVDPAEAFAGYKMRAPRSQQ